VQFLSDGEVVAVSAEVADDADARERGLMYRTHLDDDRGMLFSFDEPAVRWFWMKNTCIPLDLLFIAEDGFVVGVVENAAPLDLSDVGVPCPSVHVLEVNAGWARRHGIRAGMRAQIEL
jgi:uncharacterized membrane protein (UPF0127 family)